MSTTHSTIPFLTVIVCAVISYYGLQATKGQASTDSTSNLKPSEVTEDQWLYCRDETINGQYSDVTSWGKWMMFYKKGKPLDDMWETACKLYYEGKLTGIASMKVSTAKPNPRASDHNTGVIIFYCGPAENEASMMQYGRNLLEKIPYEHVIAYKSDKQTDGGTKATGQEKNWLYTIDSHIHKDVNRGGSRNDKWRRGGGQSSGSQSGNGGRQTNRNYNFGRPGRADRADKW